MRIALLAAGASTRFGGRKLLVPWRERPLLLHSLEHAQAACPGRVMLVTGCEAESIEAAATGYADIIVRNPDYARGIGTSIAAAARACADRVDAMIIALADQPLVTAGHYRALVSAWDRAGGSIVSTAFADTLGPPVLFGRQHITALTELDDDSGAKRILLRHRERVTSVECESAAIDVDTPDDLAALR